MSYSIRSHALLARMPKSAVAVVPRRPRLTGGALAAVAVATLLPAALAQENGHDLAKAAQNPIADVISLPFQNNLDLGVGPRDKTRNTLNIQPVVPVRLGADWNLITRTILPVIWQDDLTPADTGESEFGLGDLNPTLFFSPRGAGSVIWGAGPTFLIPTATDEVLGTEKWGIGPAGVVVYTRGPLLAGVLANNIWSFAGDDDREDVNQMLIQPFVNYNFEGGWYVVSSPIITANWEADDSGDRWTVPVGGGVGRVFNIGAQPVNLTGQAYYNVERPDSGAEWTLRLQLQFLFPQGG